MGTMWARQRRYGTGPAFGQRWGSNDPWTVTLNWPDRTLTFVHMDRSVAVHNLTGRGPSNLATATFVFGGNLLHFTTLDGNQIAVMLPCGEEDASFDERPAVYLDQLHWSTVANVVHDPARVTRGAEHAAAGRLIDLALNEAIVLPLSSAHVSETSKWRAPVRRRRLALTMLQLSFGWQMRDPLAVRLFEFEQMFTTTYLDHSRVPPAVITLEPGALDVARGARPEPEVDPPLPSHHQELQRAWTTVTVHVDLLLDAEETPMNDVPGWAAKMQRFTDWMTDESRQREQRRASTDVMFLADTAIERAEAATRAGISVEQFSDWTLHRAGTSTSSMPSLGLYREMLNDKLVTHSTRWSQNDLVDMIYLTCGAAYCDHVVTERSVEQHLRNGLRRLGRPVNTHRTLASVMEQLDP